MNKGRGQSPGQSLGQSPRIEVRRKSSYISLHLSDVALMLTLLKILTFPIWFPIRVLWFFSKVVAFIVLAADLAFLIYFVVRVL